MSPVVFEILLALKGEPLDAEGIVRGIEARGSRAPAIASFYRSLKRAADDRFIDITAPAADGAPGRPRQRYAMTRRGRNALQAEASRLRRLAEAALAPEESQS